MKQPQLLPPLPSKECYGQRERRSAAMDIMDVPLRHGCEDYWGWNRRDRSHEVRLFGPQLHTAHFHPNWSNGTAGVRGTRELNGGRYYWEILVSQRVFGTSMMFGIGTRGARLHVDAFVNLLGEDEHSWGLSHKGLLWHRGKWTQYTKPFRENEATAVGLLFDGVQGSLTYYKDGACLGVAFTGLNDVDESLYPIVCSTAAKTEMALGMMRRDFVSLQDRCRSVILRQVRDSRMKVEQIVLPNRLKSYLTENLPQLSVDTRRSTGNCSMNAAAAPNATDMACYYV